MTTKEKILKEFDEIYCKSNKCHSSLESNLLESIKSFLSQSLDSYGNQIRQEGYEQGKKDVFSNFPPEMTTTQQVRKETLSEVLKMLPEEKISVGFKTDEDAAFEDGFNICLSQIKETIEKEMK